MFEDMVLTGCKLDESCLTHYVLVLLGCDKSTRHIWWSAFIV